MSPARLQTQELDPTVISAYAATFISRDNYHPRQKDNGGYFVIEKRLHIGVVMAHLHGVMTIGAYALSSSDEAKWLCFDADDPEHWNL